MARCIAILAGLCAPALAVASPRSDSTTGRAVFTGSTVPSATSISLNPAALGLGKIDEIYLGFAGLLEQFGIDRRAIDLGSGGLADAGHVTSNRVGAGGQLAAVWHPGERGALGLELRMPPPELFPRDAALRYHALGSRQQNFVATLATSLKVSSAFYFGVSLSHDVTRLRLRYARDTALDAGLDADCLGTPCGLENPAAAETYDVTVRSQYVSTDNLKLNIGVLIGLGDTTWFGIAYHNTPGFGIQTALDGRMKVQRAERDGGAALRGDATIYVSYPASVDAELRTRLLPRFDLHVGGRWEDLSRMQAYDVRGYGIAFRDQAIPEWVQRPRGFHDAFALWAGLETAPGAPSVVHYGARLGVETSAHTAERTAPGTDSPTSITGDLGVELRLAPTAWRIQLSYGAQLFPRADIKASDYDPRFARECADSGFDYATRACEALRNGYAIPTAAGSYTRIQHALRVGLIYEFR
jgi:hypothetical protein